MSPKIVRLVGVGLALLVLVAAWFVAISPQREVAAQSRASTQGEEASAANLRSRIALLKKQSEEIPDQQADLAELRRQVPTDLNVSELVRTFTAVAKKARVSVSSITPAAAAAVAEPTPTVAVATPTDSSAAAATAQPSAQAAAAPVVADLYDQPVTVTVCGSYVQLRDFLTGVEGLPRAILVTTVQIDGNCDGSTTSTKASQAADDSDEGNGMLSAKIEAHAFARAPEEAVPTGQPAATDGSGSGTAGSTSGQGTPS